MAAVLMKHPRSDEKRICDGEEEERLKVNTGEHSSSWRLQSVRRTGPGGDQSFEGRAGSVLTWKKSDVLPPSSSPLPVCDPPSAQCVTGAHANQRTCQGGARVTQMGPPPPINAGSS
ncbi:Hypothetical protein SMAX5B_008792 [Scophthalmus maximus]|uniref:Uncharacterized protein n=1 Tax=Scophthalmus maximus TaxID=52904 RepID=A0A2U9CDB8_SCOMX|nr:Hypothetical protein SMAX5B_008792 [Scophthalmus maximus]